MGRGICFHDAVNGEARRLPKAAPPQGNLCALFENMCGKTVVSGGGVGGAACRRGVLQARRATAATTAALHARHCGIRAENLKSDGESVCSSGRGGGGGYLQHGG